MEVIHVTTFPGPFRTIIVELIDLPGPSKVKGPEAPQPSEPPSAEEPIEAGHE
jgi:hypothetical protein